MRIDKGLIPVALARAKLVRPDASIKDKWEMAIFKDLETPSLSFSWNNWLRGLIP